MKPYLIICLFIFLSIAENAWTQNNNKNDTTIECKLLRIGNYLYITNNNKSNFLDKDTIELLDIGDMGNNCISGINSDFNLKEYNVFTKKYKVREPYFDKINKDSVIAWLDLRLFVFDACIKYTNFRKCPEDSKYYLNLKYKDRMHVFKAFHYIDVKEIWLKRKNKTSIKFEDCYYPIHSLLE